MTTMRILCLRLQPWSPHDERKPERPATDDARLAGELEEFSPRIGRVAWGDAAAFCLDVGGTARWFGGEAALLDRVRDWCRERRRAATAVIADTLGAAWAVTVGDDACDPWSPFIGRIIPTETTAEALAPLPIETLRLAPALVVVLRELGFTTVEPLLAVPRAAWAVRFPPELLRRLDQALGRAPELFDSYRPEPQTVVERAWDCGVVDAETLAGLWERLLPKLLAAPAARGRGAARVLAELIGETGARCRLVVDLVRPTVDAAHLLDLLRLRLESVRVHEPVTATRLALLDEAPLEVQQQVLFAELAPPTESPAWTALVDRLAGRLGTDRVVRIARRADHEPERAWQGKPWGRRSPSVAKSRSRARRDEPPPLPPRPTCLLPKPRSISVLALAPQGHPQRFSDRGAEARVVRSWGPERIETGWWRGPSLRRDYYRIETDAARQAWVFRDLRTRRWFLHGWFD